MSIFSKVQTKRVGKTLINMSHEKKMTMSMANLVPFCLFETVPGDKWRMNVESLIRFSPLVAPMFHRVNAYFHFWYVPNRLLFDKWETFITGGYDGNQTAVMPFFNITAGDEAVIGKSTLADYMGIPTPSGTIETITKINALPFRAYQLIWNEYYRDQQLIAKSDITKDDGQVSGTEKTALLTMRKRAWEKDYFTSCLPNSQRGPEVSLPNEINYSTPTNVVKAGDQTNATGDLTATDGTAFAGTDPVEIHNIDDLTITINDLRRSARLQEFLEKTARGGARLTEVVRQFFNVTSSDARLQRPEFIGGAKTPVQVSEVLNTAGGTDPGATMYGHAISVGNTKYIQKFCEEHGWIIGIMSVLPRTAYTQSLPKHFTKFDKFDLYWPTFAQLGEQEVKNSEVYMDYKTADNYDGTFGYQSRYAEYKYHPSMVHGDFKDEKQYAWHLARIFTAPPVLNQSFIEADPSSRIFAVTDPDEDKLLVQLYNDVRAIRPMPYFNDPIL